jgi:GGDEF domain-containing protein
VARKILAAKQPLSTAAGVQCWDGAVSIGIAEAGATMAEPDDLLQAADLALYSAKRQGGARMAGHEAQ